MSFPKHYPTDVYRSALRYYTGNFDSFNHPWLEDMGVYARMLAGEICLPHVKIKIQSADELVEEILLNKPVRRDAAGVKREINCKHCLAAYNARYRYRIQKMKNAT